MKILATVGANKSGTNKTYSNYTSTTFKSLSKLNIESRIFEGSWSVAPYYDMETKDGAKSDI